MKVLVNNKEVKTGASTLSQLIDAGIGRKNDALTV